MSVNIYDAANQLERDLRQTDQFLKLKEAFDALQKDDEAKALFDQFRLTQQTLQQKQMMGQEISEDETKQAQELSQKVGDNEVLSELISAEQQLGQMIEEINQIALKPIQELYQSNQPQQPEAESSEN